MKNTIVSRSTLLLAIFLGLGITARASFVLNIIEVSSTTLTYSWMGGAIQTVIASTPDHWTFNIADNVVSSLGGDQNVNVYWQEPDYATSGLVNYINFFVHGGNGSTITVVSDAIQSEGYPLVANGGTFDFLNDGRISGGNLVMFTDQGDAVPEPTTFFAGAFLVLPFGISLVRVLRKHEGRITPA